MPITALKQLKQRLEIRQICGPRGGHADHGIETPEGLEGVLASPFVPEGGMPITALKPDFSSATLSTVSGVPEGGMPITALKHRSRSASPKWAGRPRGGHADHGIETPSSTASSNCRGLVPEGGMPITALKRRYGAPAQ